MRSRYFQLASTIAMLASTIAMLAGTSDPQAGLLDMTDEHFGAQLPIRKYEENHP